jgi:hypothetical protein
MILARPAVMFSESGGACGATFLIGAGGESVDHSADVLPVVLVDGCPADHGGRSR